MDIGIDYRLYFQDKSTAMIKRRKTRCVKIGKVAIGAGNPIAIQSMVKSKAKNVSASVKQIKLLQDAGCEIVRIAVEDKEDALSLKTIKKKIDVPLVADIHFDYRLALESIKSGVDKVRLNPGNIYKPKEIRDVILAACDAGIPMRIGANTGSLRVKGKDNVDSLVKSIKDYLHLFRKMNFNDLVLSVKASSIDETVRAYEALSVSYDYPLHVGVTATGLPMDGVVKSSVGIGVLLFKGIGDTIRVSLLGQLQQEVLTAQLLLSSLGLRKFGPEWICCPTCGRCEVNLLKTAENFQKRLNKLPTKQRALLNDLKIALMGCIVNGPGEAREADIGIAFSKVKGVLFKKGKIVGSVSLASGEDELFRLLNGIEKRGNIKCRG